MDRKKLFSEIKENMKNLYGDKLRKIVLYGSYAKNTQNQDY